MSRQQSVACLSAAAALQTLSRQGRRAVHLSGVCLHGPDEPSALKACSLPGKSSTGNRPEVTVDAGATRRAAQVRILPPRGGRQYTWYAEGVGVGL
jgi:hypothetical protein